MTVVTIDLTGTCTCGRALRGVQVADATVRIGSIRLRPGLAGFERCPCGTAASPIDATGVLTPESLAKVALRRKALRDRSARRRQARAA